MYTPHFVHSFVIEHLGCFRLLGIVNHAAMNMGVQIPFETLLSVLLDTYPEVELLNHIVFLVFTF